MTEQSLRLSDCGEIWLIEEDGEHARATLIGPAGDPATSYWVPGELLDELGRLEVAWAEAVGYGLACRAEAIDTYRRNL